VVLMAFLSGKEEPNFAVKQEIPLAATANNTQMHTQTHQ
jgi:hypothetical protein